MILFLLKTDFFLNNYISYLLDYFVEEKLKLSMIRARLRFQLTFRIFLYFGKLIFLLVRVLKIFSSFISFHSSLTSPCTPADLEIISP